MDKFLKCLKVKKVIEHKAGYYYQNRFNNNGYFSSNGLFVTYKHAYDRTNRVSDILTRALLLLLFDPCYGLIRHPGCALHTSMCALSTK